MNPETSAYFSSNNMKNAARSFYISLVKDLQFSFHIRLLRELQKGKYKTAVKNIPWMGK